MKNFMFELSEIGGQVPKNVQEKVFSKKEKDITDNNDFEKKYNYEKERKNLKNFFLSFDSSNNFLILFNLPICFN